MRGPDLRFLGVSDRDGLFGKEEGFEAVENAEEHGFGGFDPVEAAFDFLGLLRVGAADHFVGAVLEHSLDAFGRVFEVKLQAQDAVAVEEGLIGAAARAGQQQGARGERKGVSVPLKGHEGAGEVVKEGAAAAPGGELDGVPADFAVAVAFDAGAEDVGKELGAEADAEHGFFLLDGMADELAFAEEPGVGVVFIDVHEAAHDDEHVEAVEVGEGFVFVEAGAGEDVALVFGPEPDVGGIFKRDVLKAVNANLCVHITPYYLCVYRFWFRARGRPATRRLF